MRIPLYSNALSVFYLNPPSKSFHWSWRLWNAQAIHDQNPKKEIYFGRWMFLRKPRQAKTCRNWREERSSRKWSCMSPVLNMSLQTGKSKIWIISIRHSNILQLLMYLVSWNSSCHHPKGWWRYLETWFSSKYNVRSNTHVPDSSLLDYELVLSETHQNPKVNPSQLRFERHPSVIQLCFLLSGVSGIIADNHTSICQPKFLTTKDTFC